MRRRIWRGWILCLCACLLLCGAASGTGSTPPDAVSRGAFADALYDAHVAHGGAPVVSEGSSAPFRDVGSWSPYFEALCWAKASGIAGGYAGGAFRPAAPVTRQQATVMLYRYAKTTDLPLEKGSDRDLAGYRDADGTYHRTQDRLRVTFTTDLPVFSLPRKKALLPRETRETANWLYVKSIRRVPDEPHRCLSIESPDHTYLVGGYIPTHNTRVLLHLAAQWGRLPNPDDRKSTIPIVFFDPKPNSSDFGPFVKSMGGMLVRLDSPEAEGILDPVRCIPWTMKDMIVQTAVEMLSQITGGRDADRSRDLALTSIIGYGLRHGADCTGEAVRIAYKAHQEGGEDADRIDPLVEEITPMLERQATNSSMFKLIYGTRHGGRRLAVSDGLTLLSAGTMNIISEKEADSGPSDIQRWVVRMAALGASASIIGRNGVLVVDEAWSLLGDRFGVSVVNRMGRLARDQHYMPVFASQKVTEFVEAGLQDFMGRGIAMAMGSKAEFSGMESQTEQTCRLFGQPEDGEMAERMSHDQTLDSESNEPDRQSLYALFDPDTGELVRGSIGYYIGLDKTAIPVEIRISDKLV